MLYNNVSCILDVCITLLLCCVLLDLDWAEPMRHYIYMSHVHAFSCIRTFRFLYLLYSILLVLFWLSLSLPLSLFLTLVASWHVNVNPFHLETLFVPGHLLLLLILTSFHLMSGSLMKRPIRTSWRTFHDKTFIRNAKLFCQTFLTLTYPLSSIVKVGSHHVAPWSHDLPWSYRSSTPICTDLITLYPSFLIMFRVYAW